MKSKNTPFKSKFQKLTSGDISRIKKVPKITSIGGLKNIPKSNLKQYSLTCFINLNGFLRTSGFIMLTIIKLIIARYPANDVE